MRQCLGNAVNVLLLLVLLSIQRPAVATGAVVLPQTGQTVSYTKGDDGALRKGAAWPSPRFSDNGNGTVTDNLTNLVWLKKGCMLPKTWSDAITAANSLAAGTCGLSDGSVAGQWRLPNRKELQSLIDRSQDYPALPWGHPFYGLDTMTPHWSSTTGWGATAWYVSLGDGSVGKSDKSSSYYVLPVRGGQWSINDLVITPPASFAPRNLASQSLSEEATLTNLGENPVSITSISVTGTDAAHFVIAPGGATPCPNLVPIIASGQKCTVKLTFAPSSVGAKRSDLIVTTKDGAVVIPVTGSAYATVQGTVSDLSTGGKLSGAVVTVTGGANATTDSTGNFIFTKAPPSGTYSVMISKAGYGTLTISDVKVTDTSGATLNIGMAPLGTLNITSRVMPAAQVEISYKQQVTITGGSGPYRFTKAYGTIPPGLAIDAAMGSIAGAPASTGAYTFAIGVTDSHGTYAETEYTIDVSSPLLITNPATFARRTLNDLYSFSIYTKGGTPPYTVSLDSGSIPLAPTNHHYEFHATKAGWGDAKSTCDRRRGGHLATIASVAEQAKAAPTSPGFVWIGLNMLYLYGWVWDNGETSSYRNWEFWEPSQREWGKTPYKYCVAQALDSFKNTGWYAQSCFDAYSFLCENEEIPFASNDQFKGLLYPQGGAQFSIKVTDALGRVTTKSLTMDVDAPLTFSTSRLHDGVVGAAYSQMLSSTGGHDKHRPSLYSGSLPAGLTFDTATGVISGTPTEAMTRTPIFAVEDGAQRVTYRPFSITVERPLQIVSSPLPQGRVGEAYAERVRTVGGVGPFTYSITGMLPAGLTLSATTGSISGTPTAAGLTNIQVTVTDSSYPVPQTTAANLSIRITSQITISTPAELPNGKRNEAMSIVSLSGKGGTPPFVWSIVSGRLPEGVTLNPLSGAISGNPQEAGEFTVRIRVTDSAATSTEKEFYCQISEILHMETETLSNGVAETQYIQPLTVTGGLKPYRWRLKAGSLPDGLILDPGSGAIQGIPATSGTSTFTVAISDKEGQATERTYTIATMDRLVINTHALASGRQNSEYGSAPLAGTGGMAPLTWSISSGNLPEGMTLAADTGMVKGTPYGCGIFPFTVKLKDSAFLPSMVQKSFSIDVACSNDYVLSGSTNVAGATVTLGGDGNSTTTADSSGNYSFGPLSSGNYTVTPKKQQHIFSPAFREISIENQNTLVSGFVAVHDTNAPVISSLHLPVTFNNLTVPLASFAATDDLGVTGYMVTESSAAPTAEAAQWHPVAPATFTFAAPGAKTLYGWARDFVRNVSQPVIATVMIDISAPTINHYSLPATTDSLTVPVTFSATDDTGISGYFLSESDAAPTALTSGWAVTPPSSFTFPTRGAHSLHAWVKDSAGNISSMRSATVSIQLQQLVVTVSGAGNGTAVPNSGTVTWKDRRGAALYKGGTVVILTADAEDGSYFVNWTGCDSVNNNVCSVAMNTDKSVGVVYSVPTTDIVWQKKGSGLSELTGKDVYSLAIDPVDSKTIYAGAGGGIFKTTNGGELWTESGLSGFSYPNNVYALTIDPSNSQTLYAGTASRGAFKSTNGGASWSPIGALADLPVGALAIDPANDQVLYAGARHHVYKSVNGGTSWNVIMTRYNSDNSPLVIAQTNNQTLYVAHQAEGLEKSIDGGLAWSWIGRSGLPENPIYVRALAIDPADSQTVYAGLAGVGTGGVYKTVDGGRSWSATLDGLSSRHLTSLLIDQTNSQIIYAGTYDAGVFRSTNGGASWSAINSSLTNQKILVLSADPTDSQVIYAGTSGDAVFKGSSRHQLAVVRLGTSSGSVAANSGTISWNGASGTASYNKGTVVTLTATASSGSAFAGWSGCASVSGNRCTVTMDVAKVVTATFDAVPVYAACGSSNGGVLTSAPVANLCTAGTPSAVTGAGPWQWTCKGLNGEDTASCSAALASHLLSVTVTGQGSVTSSPQSGNAIACTGTGGGCSGSFPHNTTVILSATPNIISTFAGWSGACTASSATCTVSMSTDRSITAAFSAAPKAKIGNTGYSSLTAAYAAASNNARIMLLGSQFLENPMMNREIAVTISGGYHGDYNGRSSQLTKIRGCLTIRGGRVTVDNLLVQ